MVLTAGLEVCHVGAKLTGSLISPSWGALPLYKEVQVVRILWSPSGTFFEADIFSGPFKSRYVKNSQFLRNANMITSKNFGVFHPM